MKTVRMLNAHFGKAYTNTLFHSCQNSHLTYIEFGDSALFAKIFGSLS